MAQLLSGGNAAVQALLYGDVHPATQRYFEQQGSTFERLRHSAQAFAKEATERFGFMATERTQRLIRDVRRSVSWAYHGDYVRPLRSIDDIQMASPIMRRYIMAEPYVRELFHKQQLSGYDEQYTDLLPSLTGEDHPDYQRVMQDIVQVPEDDEDAAFAEHWMTDVTDDEPELDFQEQLDVIETWALTKKFILEGKQDPTSLYGATLD